MPKSVTKNHKAKSGSNGKNAKHHSSKANHHAPNKVRASASRGSPSRSAAESHAQPVCREPACENLVIALGYCRLHYIKNWQRIKRKEAILTDGRLRQYIEELISKYSDKYIEAIRHDLMTDDVFVKVITELDLHESEDEIIDIDSSGAIDEYPMEGVRPDIESRDDEF